MSRERHELISAPFRSSLAECLARTSLSSKLSGARSLPPLLSCNGPGEDGRVRRPAGRSIYKRTHRQASAQALSAASPRRQGGEPYPPVRRTWSGKNWAQSVSLPCKVGSGLLSPTSPVLFARSVATAYQSGSPTRLARRRGGRREGSKISRRRCATDLSLV